MLDSPRDKNRALLVGTSKCSPGDNRLDALQSASVSIKQLDAYLDPYTKVRSVYCPPIKKPKPVLDRLKTACQEATGVLIFCFCGHAIEWGGRKKASRELYLTVGNTAWNDVNMTGLSFSMILDAIAMSKAAKKLILLDCCHSETGLGALQNFKQRMQTEGVAAMGSAQSQDVAMSGPDNEPTLFMGLLLDILRRGPKSALHSDDGRFTIYDVYKEIRQEFGKLRKKNPAVQRPVFYSEDLGGELVVGEIDDGFPPKIGRELVKKSIGVDRGKLPRMVEDHVAVIGLFRGKQLAFELKSAVARSKETIERFRDRRLVSPDRETFDSTNIRKEADDVLCEIHTEVLLLRRRVQDECHMWSLYTQIAGPIVEAIDDFRERCLWIAMGYAVRDFKDSEEYLPSPDFQSDPELKTFAAAIPHFKKEVDQISANFAEWERECQKFYESHCDKLNK